jgi:predicted glutamine amidotransferase
VCGEALYRIGRDDGGTDDGGTAGLVVASEPTDARPGWRRLHEGTLLSAWDGGGGVRESSL